ncbi:MAG: hypothetical protein M1817_004648 [Caeruleum heppii]|nr:MAG: hypothetical protein M1817_004648 [Caeruleum heppii]
MLLTRLIFLLWVYRQIGPTVAVPQQITNGFSLDSLALPDLLEDEPGFPDDSVAVPFTKLLLNFDASSVAFPAHTIESAKRQLNPAQYVFRYSRVAIKSTRNETLYALPVKADAVRGVLRTAIATGKTHGPAELSSRFWVSASNLSVIMQSRDEMPGLQSFSWADFLTIAAIMTQATAVGNNFTGSFVGVVIDPDGRPVVDVAILPAVVRVSYNSTDSNSDAVASGSAGRGDGGNKLRQRELITFPIKGTSYDLSLSYNQKRVMQQALVLLAQYVVDLVQLDYDSDNYAAIETSRLTSSSAEIFGDATFSLRTLTGRLSRDETLAILKTVLRLVNYHTRLHEDPTRLLHALSGRVLNDSGVSIAQWSIGEAAGSIANCAQMLVEHPDGSFAVGCLAT